MGIAYTGSVVDSYVKGGGGRQPSRVLLFANFCVEN